MTIKEFIEAAIEGGWENKELPTMTTEDGIYGEFITAMYWHKMFPTVVLDPEAWKAVGKVKGWKEDIFYSFDGIHHTGQNLDEAQWYQLSMMNALWEGQTLEEYIATL